MSLVRSRMPRMPRCPSSPPSLRITGSIPLPSMCWRIESAVITSTILLSQRAETVERYAEGLPFHAEITYRTQVHSAASQLRTS